MTNSTPSLDLGSLSGDEEIVRVLTLLHEKVGEVRDHIVPLLESNVYSTLSTEDKVKHDMFVSYTLTSLYWIYLRTLGKDPFAHPVKTEIERIQEYVARFKKVKDRKKAPQLDKGAAKRFIRSGLWDPNNPPEDKGDKKTFD